MKWDIDYVIHYVFAARDDKGELEIVKKLKAENRPKPGKNPVEEEIRNQLWVLGRPKWFIEETVERWREQNREMLKAVYAEPVNPVLYGTGRSKIEPVSDGLPSLNTKKNPQE